MTLRNKNQDNSQNEDSEFTEYLIHINRVTKVVKGGRRFSIAVIMIVGDSKGRVGYGTGKAKEMPEARAKATQEAKKNMHRIHLKEGRTLHHDVKGFHGAGKVILRSAKPGTGIIAGGPMRAIFNALGIHDVVAKSIGSSNPYNMLGATIDALQSLSSPKYIAEKRGKKISEITSRRTTVKSNG